MNVLNKPIVLSCNKLWKALKPTTPEKALIDMAKETVLGVHIEYFQGPDGEFDFDNPIVMEPVGWEKWLTLKPRPFDFVIHTPRMEIRVPTVIICAEYAKTPHARKKCTPQAIWERDGGVCQYSGRKLKKSEGNIDHVRPRSRGGKTSWENCVLADKSINSMKGDRLNEEVGLKLIRKPKAPPLLPVGVDIKEVVSPDWKHFLIK